MTEIAADSPAQEKEDRRPLERRCQGETKEGKPCPLWTVKGERLCSGHLGLGVGAGGDAARAAQRQSARSRHEQATERKRSVSGAISHVAERHSDAFAERLADIALHGAPPEALRALDLIYNRVLGKPDAMLAIKQLSPETKEDLMAMSTDQLWQLMAEQLGADVDQLLTEHSEATDEAESD